MGYQALLFCPDEKLARVVTQVLSDLDFSVEPATEPFAAVKKLMAQHFDAVVVDCDNEKNATLLFKSARNSSSNQSSLAVAVVEGQAGVAKAFRIGANLVLTKPINVEQAKGTLRVARGLLRKGADAKTATASKPAAAPATPQTSRPEVNFETPRSIQPSSAKPPASFEPKKPISAPVASAGPLEQETEPVPSLDAADAAMLESLHDPASASHETKPRKDFAWKPVKPQSGSMASALQRAAEAAGKNVEAAPPKPQPTLPDSMLSAQLARSAGAAAAPAMAKDLSVQAAALPSTTSARVSTENHSYASYQEASAPSFGALGADDDDDEASKSKKPYFIIAAIVIAAGMAFYGWTTKHSSSSSAPTPPAPVVAAPAPVESAPPPPPATTTPAQSTPAVISEPASVEHESSTSAKPAKPSNTPKSSLIAEDTVTKVAPLVVKNSSNKSSATSQSEPAPQAPGALSIVSGSSNDATLSNLVASTPVTVPGHTPQTLKISQGVSQGLILKRVQPVYPQQALHMRVQGSVQLLATISKEGQISNLSVMSGDGMLARAATDAVRQWKYKPYYLNGEPVEIQTQITVNFKLPN